MSVNQIDGSGIQTKTMADIIASLTTAFQSIYGSDINLDQNSPDGQLLNEIALICYDHGNFVKQSYASKDPEQAMGVSLDAVAQLAGLTRRGGTYTEVPITITTDRTLNLNGQDTSSPFTVADTTGNKFQLIESASLSSGANTLSFRAEEIGNVQVSLNTLTNITTPILGVISANNPTAPSTQGEDQETDSAFRLRRAAALSIPAQSALDGLRSGLRTLDGVIDSVVRENTGASPDGDGIPGHGIWVIVRGGTTADIAGMINRYRSGGIPMAGAVEYDVAQADGTDITIAFDTAVAQSLYISFTAVSKSGGAVDTTALKAGLAEALTYGIYEIADVSSIIATAFAINPDIVISGAGVSNTAGSYLATKLPAAKKNYWTVSTANIAIS